MQNPNQPPDPQKPKQLPGEWHGLGNKPRNENLAKIRVGSFEKQENLREQVIEPDSLYSFKENEEKIRRR